MKVEELRLNNYVYSGVRMVKVKSIHTESVLKDEVSIYIELNENLSHYCVSMYDIKPIELTEEILLKCGFVKCSYIDNHYNVLGMVIWNCNGMFICNKNGVQLKYLHQLQNLYFALTSKELEINI